MNFISKLRKFTLWQKILIVVIFIGFLSLVIFFVSNNNVVKSKNTSISVIVPSDFVKVIKVVDGDTIDVLLDSKVQRIRVIGIDTPEIVDSRKPVECFAKEASDKAKETLEDKKVRLEVDSSQDNYDKYGRLLRYVYLEDGTNFGLKMIKDGYAYEYTYFIPYKYQSEFRLVQKEAKSALLGLWGSPCLGGR